MSPDSDRRELVFLKNHWRRLSKGDFSPENKVRKRKQSLGMMDLCFFLERVQMSYYEDALDVDYSWSIVE